MSRDDLSAGATSSSTVPSGERTRRGTRCSAWGCRNEATGHRPDPTYAHLLEKGHGVPWHPFCDLPVGVSKSGKTFVHDRGAR